MGRTPAIVGLALLVLAASVPMGDAHAPPDPRAMDTRLLTDANDDCGNHAQQGCLGGLDLLALSVREVRDATHGDGVVFTLWYAPGDPQATHTVTIEAGLSGRQDSLSLELEKRGLDWQANGSYVIDGPYPIADEATDDRVGIDVWYALAQLGLTTEDRLFGFDVTSRVDGTARDIMPGTYLQDDGTEAAPSEAEQTGPTATETLFYALGNPPRYVDLTGPAVFDVEPGTSQSWTLVVSNLFHDAPQTVRIQYAAPDGIQVSPGAADANDPDTALVRLDPRGTEAVQVVVAADLDAEIVGGVTITYHTDLGGFASYTVPLSIAEQAEHDEEPRAGLGEDGGLAWIGWLVGIMIVTAIATVLVRGGPKT